MPTTSRLEVEGCGCRCCCVCFCRCQSFTRWSSFLHLWQRRGLASSRHSAARCPLAWQRKQVGWLLTNSLTLHLVHTTVTVTTHRNHIIVSVAVIKGPRMNPAKSACPCVNRYFLLASPCVRHYHYYSYTLFLPILFVFKLIFMYN